MKIHFLGAGDIIFSLGTRYHIGQLVSHLKRRRRLSSFSLFQFRNADTPHPDSQSHIEVDGFPFKVYCPTIPQQYERWPRQVFRCYERLLLWNYFRKITGRIKPGEKIMLHGCVGAVHLTAVSRISVKDKMWLKLGLIEEENNRGLRFYARKQIERFNSHRCGRRIVVSKKMLDFLTHDYGRSRHKDFVLPCLYDTDKFSPSIDRAEVRSRLGFDKRVVFLYLGIGAQWQCPAETIEFFKLLKKRLQAAFLWILTPDQDIFRPILSDLSSEDYRLEYCPHNELANRIQAADFGFLLRRRSLINKVASPVKFPEYLASGLSVVIGPEVGDYTDLVKEHGIGVVIDPDKPEEWERGISKILALVPQENGLRLRTMAVADSLSWQSRIDQVVEEFGKA